MAILAECPICHRKQANKNRICSCGEDIVKAKRSNRVKYWITFRIEGKQRRESVGYSLKEAQDAEGKRKSQKRENRIFDMLPESKIIFSELMAWYLDLKSVKRLKSFARVEGALKNFNAVFGQHLVNKIKPEDLENYQIAREEQGRAPATIDMEVKMAQTVVTKAFDNDKIDAGPLRAFRRVKRRLKKGSNARKRKLTIEEYNSLLSNAAGHLRNILIVAMNTGMRVGEIRCLE
ncbi:MAG: hypothetical protein U9O82_10125 [Thermodesulfobacteriota bacterium]|nr:hypothetical protein [Thermodesulfobacteriota bacterium]